MAYDRVRRIARVLLSNPGEYRVLNSFSHRYSQLNFLQIGASDGLRNDPIREFVVRDGWGGVLVEALPHPYNLLVSNYRYLKRTNLVFVNAAVSDHCGPTAFWTCREEFLARYDVEEQLSFLRKSSMQREHLVKHLARRGVSDEQAVQVEVPSVTVNDLYAEFFGGRPLDLLVIDAEGHEATIIPSIDFERVRPKGIFFESASLGVRSDDIRRLLMDKGYAIQDLRGDTFALVRE